MILLFFCNQDSLATEIGPLREIGTNNGSDPPLPGSTDPR